MSLSNRLLDILCCPETKVPVKICQKSILKQVNVAIAAGDIKYNDESLVSTPLAEALITDNAETIYRVDDGIPVMLADKGISLHQAALAETRESLKS